jgi:hypothetical protein
LQVLVEHAFEADFDAGRKAERFVGLSVGEEDTVARPGEGAGRDGHGRIRTGVGTHRSVSFFRDASDDLPSEYVLPETCQKLFSESG